MATSADPPSTTPYGHSPLLALVATLDSATLPGETARLEAVRAAERALVRIPAAAANCAQSLGAARYAALNADLARARQLAGDRSGALEAAQRAIDCEPREAQHRVARGYLLLTMGQLDEAQRQADRAAGLQATSPGLRELQARLAYVAGQWSEAARRSGEIAAGRQAEFDAQRSPMHDEPEASDLSDSGIKAAVYWRLFARLAQRRGGLPENNLPAPDVALEDRWPVPLWRWLNRDADENDLVAAIESQQEPLRQRELACEALYYTAQEAFAAGHPLEGRERLARLVNLKILYFDEHELALAELARLRSR